MLPVPPKQNFCDSLAAVCGIALLYVSLLCLLAVRVGLEGLTKGLGMSQDEAKSLVVKGCSIMIMARPRQLDTFMEVLNTQVG